MPMMDDYDDQKAAKQRFQTLEAVHHSVDNCDFAPTHEINLAN